MLFAEKYFLKLLKYKNRNILKHLDSSLNKDALISHVWKQIRKFKIWISLVCSLFFNKLSASVSNQNLNDDAIISVLCSEFDLLSKS